MNDKPVHSTKAGHSTALVVSTGIAEPPRQAKRYGLAQAPLVHEVDQLHPGLLACCYLRTGVYIHIYEDTCVHVYVYMYLRYARLYRKIEPRSSRGLSQ